MRDARVRSLATLLAVSLLAGGVWLALEGKGDVEKAGGEGVALVRSSSPPPIAPEPMPAPFGERGIRRPDPMEPAPSPTAAYCAGENWSRLDARVSPGEAGEFRVDPALWSGSLTGTRAGIASWISQCKCDGERVRIVAADSGVLLATYDPASGLHTPTH